jgi:hypothetical protein
MDDKEWIQHLQDGMKRAGWTPVGPDQTGEGWIAGAVRFEAGSTGATGPTGFGKTPMRAVEDTYRQIAGDLPHRPGSLRDGEGFEHEFEGIPQADVNEIRSIRADCPRRHLIGAFAARTLRQVDIPLARGRLRVAEHRCGSRTRSRQGRCRGSRPGGRAGPARPPPGGRGCVCGS